jgi:hypothetical protein
MKSAAAVPPLLLLLLLLLLLWISGEENRIEKVHNKSAQR